MNYHKKMPGEWKTGNFPLSYSRIEAVVNTINDSGRKIRLLGGTAYLEGETEENPCFVISGEVSSREGNNIYTNLTFIIASLSEDKESYISLDEPDVAAVQTLQEENVKSLNFLLANATKALSEELSYREDMLRLFSGVSETYSYLTDCYQKLANTFSGPDLNIYSYQDTSVLYAGNDSVTNEEFEKIVDKMQDFLNSRVYGDIKLS